MSVKISGISVYGISVMFYINDKFLFIQNFYTRILVNCQPVNCRLIDRSLNVLLEPHEFILWENVFFFQCCFLSRILQNDRKSIFFSYVYFHV